MFRNYNRTIFSDQRYQILAEPSVIKIRFISIFDHFFLLFFRRHASEIYIGCVFNVFCVLGTYCTKGNSSWLKLLCYSLPDWFNFRLIKMFLFSHLKTSFGTGSKKMVDKYYWLKSYTRGSSRYKHFNKMKQTLQVTTDWVPSLYFGICYILVGVKKWSTIL